jgi:thymidylate synthase (FAD)
MSLKPEQQAEIDAQRGEVRETRRAVAPGLEARL